MTDVARRLEDKVVVITGSTRGVGAAIAHRCAREGARVVVTGRSAERGEAVVSSIRDGSGQAMFVCGDVTIEKDMAALFDAPLKEWGSVDGIVANAANLSLGALDGPVTEISLDGWNQLIAADLTSVFLTAKHGLKAIMKGGRGGAMIAIGSLAGVRGNIGHDAYSAAKGGVVALTQAIAAYYSRYAIRCNVLNLGFVDSGSDRVEQVLQHQGFRDMLLGFHLGSWGKAENVAGIAAMLLSDDGRYVNGASIPVDGGAYAASHMPRPTVQREITGFPAIQNIEKE